MNLMSNPLFRRVAALGEFGRSSGLVSGPLLSWSGDEFLVGMLGLGSLGPAGPGGRGELVHR